MWQMWKLSPRSSQSLHLSAKFEVQKAQPALWVWIENLLGYPWRSWQGISRWTILYWNVKTQKNKATMCLRNSKNWPMGLQKKWNLRRQIPAVTARLVAEKKTYESLMAQAECAERNRCQASKETKIYLLRLEKKPLKAVCNWGCRRAKWQVAPAGIIPKNKWKYWGAGFSKPPKNLWGSVRVSLGKWPPQPPFFGPEWGGWGAQFWCVFGPRFYTPQNSKKFGTPRNLTKKLPHRNRPSF